MKKKAETKKKGLKNKVKNKKIAGGGEGSWISIPQKGDVKVCGHD